MAPPRDNLGCLIVTIVLPVNKVEIYDNVSVLKRTQAIMCSLPQTY